MKHKESNSISSYASQSAQENLTPFLIGASILMIIVLIKFIQLNRTSIMKAFSLPKAL
jgi:hypothetical protein